MSLEMQILVPFILKVSQKYLSGSPELISEEIKGMHLFGVKIEDSSLPTCWLLEGSPCEKAEILWKGIPEDKNCQAGFDLV